jgi:phosphoglycolate phosphatase
MTLDTLIFDFDGTLANSFDAALRVATSLAPEFGYRPAQPHEIEAFRGGSYRGIAAELGVAWHKIPLIATRIRKELRDLVSSMPTYEGLPDVLAELHRRGVKLGILTSNERSNVELFLAARGLDYFDFITESASLWGKERRLRSLLRSRSLDREHVAYVGDEVRDIEATKPLGICMIAVGWGFTTQSRLAAFKPDHLLSSPEELLTIPGIKPGSTVPRATTTGRLPD